MTIGTISIIVGVVLLVLLSLFSKEEERDTVENDELFKEEPEVDPSWSVLPGNVWHSDEN